MEKIKRRYRAFINGSSYFCYSTSAVTALRLLRRRVFKLYGKADVTELAVEKDNVSNTYSIIRPFW